MKMLSTAALLAAAALSLAGCHPTSQANPDDVKRQIADLESQLNQAFAEKNADKLASFYADDALMANPGMPAASGKAAILNAYRQITPDPNFTVQFHATRTEVAGSGDLAVTFGPYQMTYTAPSHQVMHDSGSYQTTYRKQSDGSWKAVFDMASSAGQAAPGAPAPAPATP